jgi:hypothetical protein
MTGRNRLIAISGLKGLACAAITMRGVELMHHSEQCLFALRTMSAGRNANIRLEKFSKTYQRGAIILALN